MAIFTAYNAALSATTAIAAGTSYATGAKCALQLAIPANGYIDIVEWGIDFSTDYTSDSANLSALFEIAVTATATTGLTAHTTTTVQPMDRAAVNGAATSRLTMGTAATGFGAVAITTNTTLGMADRGYIKQSGLYRYVGPEGRYYRAGNTSAHFVQFRLNTSATAIASIYMKWDEHIL
jgi:hypothetical protein